MESAEAQLREIQLALRYCELDYEDILEDYREYLKDLKRKTELEKNIKLFPKPSENQ